MILNHKSGSTLDVLECAALLALLTLTLHAEQPPCNLAPNPSFELDLKRLGGWLPLGVIAPDQPYGVSIVDEPSFRGERALKILPAPNAAEMHGNLFFADYNGGEGERKPALGRGVHGARTIALRLEPNVESIETSLWIKAPPTAKLQLSALWTTRRDRKPVVDFHRDSVQEPLQLSNGWARLTLRAPRPANAIQVQIGIESDSIEPFFVDDVELFFHRQPEIKLLVNQLGYEPNSEAKRVILQSTEDLAQPPPARLIELGTFKEVLRVDWTGQGYLSDWGYYHWVADFSALQQEGEFVVVSGQGRARLESPKFRIRADLLPSATAKLAYRFYEEQRCGIAVAGVHPACHLDDAKLPDGTFTDLTGGWHDAGDYNKYNGLTPEAVRNLIQVYWAKPTLYDAWDENKNGLADLVDEAAWGAAWLEKMLDHQTLQLMDRVSSGYRYWGAPELETDNRPATGDERPVGSMNGDRTHLVAAFARLGQRLADRPDPVQAQQGKRYVELSSNLYKKLGGSIDPLLALFHATSEARYRELARQKVEEIQNLNQEQQLGRFRELVLYALDFPEDPLCDWIRTLATPRLEELQQRCHNPFGVAQVQGPNGQLSFCRAYADVNDWYVGETSTRLDVAIDGLLIARLGQPKGRLLAELQLNWLLGCNPAGVCLMEGVGSVHVPGYHHRYNAIPGNPRGAVSGALVNGFVRAFPGVDRPWLDLFSEPNADYHSNEPWLLHNNRWLLVLAYW